MSDRDITAISTWDRRDAPDPTPRTRGTIQVYACDTCGPLGGSPMAKAIALAHQRATGHPIRHVATLER